MPTFRHLGLDGLCLSFAPSSLFVVVSSTIALSTVPRFLTAAATPRSLTTLCSAPMPVANTSLLAENAT